MLKVVRVDDIRNIPPHEWNDLVAQNETSAIFLTHQWISDWLNTLGNGKETFILKATEDEKLVGVAPLLISKKKSGFGMIRVLEFIGMGESDYCDFIALTEKKNRILESFFAFICENRSMWDIISLDNIPEQSSTTDFLRNYFKKSRMKLVESVSSECPALSIRTNDEFARDCLRKKNIRVTYNQLSKAGKLEYIIALDENEILHELDRFFEFHEDRRFLLGDQSKFLRDEPKEFYKSLVKSMTPEGWLRFDILKFNDKPIAYHFGFLFNESLVYYTPTFNLDYFKRSPGTVLFRFMLEDSINKNLKEFDFARGAEWYKERFANEIRKNLKFEIYKTGSAAFLNTFPTTTKKYVKQKSPKTYQFLKTKLNPLRFSYLKQDVTYVVRRIGIFKATAKFIAKLFKIIIFTSESVIIFKTYPGDRTRPTLSEDFTIRDGQFSDLKNFLKSTPEERKVFLQTALERLKNGSRLYVVTKNDHVVHYAWANLTKRIDLPEVCSHLDLDNDVGYTFHGYTDSAYRGHGIYAAVMSRIIDDFEKEGTNDVYVYCLTTNKASRKSIEKAGFKPYLIISMTRILGIKLKRRKTIQ